MSSMFFETLGRATWWGMKRQTRRSLGNSTVRYGAIAALIIGVLGVGAVVARSHAPAE